MAQQSLLSAPVGIIGTGVAGIINAHVLLQDGFTDVTLISHDRSIGGIWAKERVYDGLRTNNVQGEYRFSSLAMPGKASDGADPRLTGADLCRYMELYSETFLVGKAKLNFQTEVSRIWRDQQGMWRVHSQDLQSGESKEYLFSRLILCTGGAHSPNIPPALSVDSAQKSGFHGSVFHSSQFAQKSSEIINDNPGLAYVVVGGGKSAQDIAAILANEGFQVTVVYEKLDVFFAETKPLPDSFRKSRFLSTLSPHIELKTRLEKFLHTTTIGATVTQKIWESMVKGSFSAYSIPKDSPLRLVSPAFWSIRSSDEGVARSNSFHALVNSGKIKVVAPTRAVGFSEAGLLLADGRSLPADVVILATGYQSSWTMFDESTAQELGITKYKPTTEIQDEWNYLSLRDPPPQHPENNAWVASIYRGIIPARNINQRDFAIGGALFTVNPGYTNEVVAHWISSYFQGDHMRLPPTPEEATKEAERVATYAKIHYPQTPLWKNLSGGATSDAWTWPQAADELLEDMYLPSRRSGGNWLTWPFKVIDLDEISTLGDERRALREEQQKER